MLSPSRRKSDSRRQRTRDRLRACALERFAEFGFNKATVADIAADAGVTERTFYRHFAAKEAVLFADHESRLEWLGAALELRPESEPILDSIGVAVESFPDDREVLRQVAKLRDGLLRPDVLAAQLQRVQGAFATEIRRHLLRRLAGRSDAELVAAVMSRAIAGALMGALDVWGRAGGEDPTELGELTIRALELLRKPLSEFVGGEG
ncbi:MAG: TetR family transcriptional regulator [Deltaproteobacteria bacterium]|nr:TetR family transcriptional regulator [Deltaproteobacteria bacterium]